MLCSSRPARFRMEPSDIDPTGRSAPPGGPEPRPNHADAPRHELAGTSDHYHALFCSMDQGFCVLELQFDAAGQKVVDFICQQVNPAFSQQLGIPEGALGKTSREVIPDLEPFWFDTYGRVALTGESVRTEHYVPQVGRWFDVHTFRVGAAKARQVGVLFHDITARKQAEAQLHWAAAAAAFRLQLADALAPLADAVALQEAVTRLTRQQFGADRCYYVEIAGGQALIRRDAAADGLPSVAGTYPLADFVLLQAALAAGRPFGVRDARQDPSVDEGLRQLCARLHVVSCLIVPVLKHGQAVGVLCVVQGQPRDWTDAEAALAAEVAERTWAAVECARAETALTASEEKYRTLFDSVDEGFVISELLYDEQGRPTDARMLETNASYDRITQTTGAAGRRANEVFLSESESIWFERYAHVVETGEGARFEHYFAPLDSWIEIFVVRVGGAGSRRFASVFTDVTARKRHEHHAAFLDELSQALAVLDGPDDIVRATGEHLGAYLGVGFLNVCDVALAAGDEPAEARVTVAAAWERAGLPSPRGTYRAGDYLSPEFLRAARVGEAIVIRDTDTDPRVDAAAYRALGMRAFVAVPVLNDGAWPGLISAFVPSPRDWRPDEVELLVEAGHRVFPRIERARTEAALAASEAQLRSFVTASSDVLYRMDANWQHLLHLDGRGFVADTAAPTASWLETYIPPADRAAVQAAMQAAIAGPHFFALEHRVVRADGLVGWTSSHAVPVRNARGELVEWFGTATDITARKHAEEALRASEQRQRALVTNLPGAAVFVVGRDLRYQVAEGDALRQVGHEPADFLGRTVQEMIAPEQWPGYRACYEEALAGRPFEYEHKQGGRTFLTRGAPLPGPDGEVDAVLAVSYDLTNRQRAEDALRQSEEKYRALFDRMQQGFGIAEILVDEAGRPVDYRMLEINPQFEQLTGQSRATFLDGRTVREIAPGLEEEWYTFYGNVGLTGVAAHCDIHAEAWNRWFEVMAYQTGRPEQRQVGIFFSDITERKRVEQQLAEFSTQLEQQVVERTHELRESRRLLQTVFDASPTAIVVMRTLHDAAGRAEDFEFLITNEFNKQIVGRDDLAGQRFSAVFPQTGPTGVLARLLQVATTGEPADFEQWYVGEGMQQWFRLIAVRQDGLLVMTSEVITARKQAEQERTRTLRLLEQAEAVAGLGSWDYDLLSGQFLWSEGMYQLFGLPLGQAIEPHVYLDFVVDEDRPRAEQFVRCLTTGCADFEDILRLQVGGQVKTVRLKLVVLPDAAGQPVRTVGVDLDISQLQRLEADNLRLRLTQQRALFEAVQDAQEAERKRMAESLHNGIGQTLYATKLRLDQLHAPLLAADAALVAARNEANRLLSEAIRQTRALSHELVPMALEKFGLAAALQDIGSNMSTPRLHLRCVVQLDEDAGPLPPALQMALYRMAQELAQNIVKHARGATAASLELETTPGWALLRAEDNGAGFAAPPAERSGLGLRSICDRVALLGGQLQMGSAPAGGAYVRIRIPLPIPPVP